MRDAFAAAVAKQGGKRIVKGSDPYIAELEKQMDDLEFLKNDKYMKSVV